MQVPTGHNDICTSENETIRNLVFFNGISFDYRHCFSEK